MAWPAVRSAWAAALDLLAPASCPLCGGRIPAGGVCRRCRLPNAAWVERRIGQDDRGVYLTLAGGALEGPLRELVHAFKYRQDPGALRLLARQTARALPRRWGGWDGLVPVPAHPVRRRERGWDAVDGLAERLSGDLGLPVLRLLVRARYCVPLTGHGRLERRRLLAGTLAARPSWGRLLLVDDVTTTGATYRVCRRLLIEAGAVSVDLLTAARTPARPGGRRVPGL